MSEIHDLIYRLEEGGGKRWLRIAAAALAVLLIAVSYNWLCFRNMGTQEAMDYAQLGRNLAAGKGFTTLFIRPFSIYLLQNRAAKNPALPAPWESADPARLKGEHPDISNAPVYPLLLAALMKVLPLDFQVDLTHRFWSASTTRAVEDWEQGPQYRVFRRFQPDFIISAFNQVVFLAVTALSFSLARRLFDFKIAIFSTALMLGADVLWRFSVSGLPTMVLLLIFTYLLWCLVRLQELAGEPDPNPAPSEVSRRSSAATTKQRNHRGSIAPRKPLDPRVLAAGAGALVALGGLTRYPFAWLILPVVLFIMALAGRKGLVLGLITLLMFSVVFTPWIIRNYSVSGAAFGTASYAVLEGNLLFPGNQLQRSLNPDLSLPGLVFLKLSWFKFLSNSRQIIQNDLARLGGTWVSSFFLIGLVARVANRRARYLGYFLASCLVILVIVQGFARTQLSEDSPDINSENLLVLLLPAVWIYGAGLFYNLLGQVRLPRSWRGHTVAGVFGVLTCLPMILRLLAGRGSPVVFPPYYPPSIQSAAAFVKGDELMMSDIPWAVAWYGRAECVWLTQNKQDFFTINDRQKTIQALYLTHASSAGRFESLDQWIRAGDENWGDLILSCVTKKKQGEPGPPSDFPLEFWQKGWPMQFLLTSREKPVRPH